jgi:triphosphatase
VDEADLAPLPALPPAAAEATLEFDIEPAALARLLRSPSLATCRTGRARSGAVRIVWHDNAAGDLAAARLAVAEQNGHWRLERLHPAAAPDWPPATPAPVLAEADAPALLGPLVPDALAPVAAFTGRQRSYTLILADAPARLDVLEGALRGIAEDLPACRVRLTGAPSAIATLAIELAQHARLEVPQAGLAACALAVAHGTSVPPRHLGTPHIPHGLSMADAIGAVLSHLADVILHWAPLAPEATTPEPVHQIRVAVRRLRSALVIFRRAAPDAPFRELGRDLKALATPLGAARDWDVFLAETGAHVQPAFIGDKRVIALLAAAHRKRGAAYAALGAYLRTESWHRLALYLAVLPTMRPWMATEDPAQQERLAAPAADFAANALHRQYKRMLGAGAEFAALEPAALHELRKQGKKLRYAAEFFTPLFAAKRVRRFTERLVELQETLGAVNDGTVAADLMAELEGGADRAFAVGVVRGYVAATSAPAASRAGKAWRKFTETSPFWD